MKINNTWRTRLGNGERIGRTVGRWTVMALATLAGLNVLWQVFFGAPTDVIGPARTVVNKSAVVSSFAQDFVSVWLTATQSNAASLNQFVSVESADLRLPSTPAVVIGTPTVVAVTFAGIAGADNSAEVYSVVVGVTQRPYESASPTRALYRVPVLWSKFGPRATSFPARVGGPGAGADLPMSYPATLGPADPAFQVVAGFLKAYLTAEGGVERYVTSTSMLTGLGDAYQNVTVTAVRAGQAPATSPAEGETTRVVAFVDATTSQYAPTQLVYPMTLVGVGGKWSVANLDQAPAVAANADLVPVVTTAGGS